MNKSESIKFLAVALSRVQTEVEHARKNAVNPHFKNRYADLTEVIDTVLPIMTKHGLAVVQFPGYEDGVTTVETVLTHESGEWMSGTAGARVQKDDPQGVGSAITYLRRYSLAAVCAIGQEDDDGEAARHTTAPMHAERHAPTPSPANGNGGFSLNDLVPVGKHKGKRWSDLVELQPDYVEWAVQNMSRLGADGRAVLGAALEARESTPAMRPMVRPGTPLSQPGDDLPY